VNTAAFCFQPGLNYVLPSIDLFRSEVQQCTRRVQRTLCLSIGAMVLALILSIAASKLSTDWLGPVASRFVPAGAFLIGLPLMLFGFWRADQQIKSFAALHCTGCGKPLLQSAGIVIASKNCPHCGRPALASEASAEQGKGGNSS
jgi:hypothetical protein